MLKHPNASVARLVLGASLALAASATSAVCTWAVLPVRVLLQSAVVVLPAQRERQGLPAVKRMATEMSPAEVAGTQVDRIEPEQRSSVVGSAPATFKRMAVTLDTSTLELLQGPQLALLDVAPVAPVPSAVAPQRVSQPSNQGYENEIELPLLLEAARPRYPSVSRRLRVPKAGDVLVSVDLDERGKPVAVAVMSSNLGKAYQASAMSSVRRSRFEPARKNGIPVSCTALVTVRFALAPSLNLAHWAPPIPAPRSHSRSAPVRE